MNQHHSAPHEAIDPTFVPLQLQTRTTWFTTALIAVFALIFGIELLTSQSWVAPTSLALVTMGALSHFLILEHNEWYRILAAAFLHGSYMHLLFNSLALHMVGRPLEMLIGRKWLWGLFILSALGGGLFSLVINSSSTLSVGASGGIMGLIAALFVLSYRFPKGKDRKRTQIQLLYMLVPALLPIFTIGQMKIDFAAHFGGAITGAIFAYGFYLSWKNQHAPKWIKFGTPLLVLTSLITLVTLIWAGFNYSKIQKELRLESGLIPSSELQKFMSEPEASLVAQLQQWKIEFPKDPRVPYLLAMISLDQNELQLAEDQAQEALQILTESQSKMFQERFEYEIRSTLALVQLRSDKKAEAKETIQPVCPIAMAALSEDPRHAEIKALCEEL
ncbi:MAG: rhomboid family intramembrane serine protease [Bdellovibrionaceae bacterium]|nr:rhomboid family intramembrane serine protease [Pseudobdellovibrionaceae bacterium]